MGEMEEARALALGFVIGDVLRLRNQSVAEGARSMSSRTGSSSLCSAADPVPR